MPSVEGDLWQYAKQQLLERLEGQSPPISQHWQSTVDVLLCSEFIQRVLLRDPSFAEHPWAIEEHPYRDLTRLTELDPFLKALRVIRRRELARIGWRDLHQRDEPAVVLRRISTLADQTIQVTTEWFYQQLTQRHGVPRDSQGNPMPLVVLGLGKLGGQELNYSSDIDLIFLYEEDGEIDHPNGLENFEFFTRLGQRVIQALDNLTEDGWVYRVDMRLRPYGESGPLAASFSFLEKYFYEQGRDWERYAWIKARAITGEAAYESLYREVVRPFVYRRYLDFSVFESLRVMHERITREVERREWQQHLKLGPGGIREIEFTVQMFQLLRGGIDVSLQSPSILNVLPKLSDPKMLPVEAVNELLEAYHFLRRAENRLQMMDEQQRHALPEDPLERLKLVKMLHQSSWEELITRLDGLRANVTRHFKASVFAHQQQPEDDGADEGHARADPHGRASTLSREPVLADWQRREDIAAWLDPFSLSDPSLPLAALDELRQSRYFGRLSDEGKRRLQRLLPVIVTHEVAIQPNVLLRVWRIFEAIGHRLNYLSLLFENPQALRRLIDLCGLGDFLVDQISAMPLLLDELIDERLFEDIPTRQSFERDLSWRLQESPTDDEVFVEKVRDFQRVSIFRVALLDLTNRLPLMSVSDRLTEIAELVLERVLNYSWARLVERYGEPQALDHDRCRVAIIAYGKLAGREMGYGSDLDIVFLHQGVSESQETSGPQIIENSTFFVRLGQKIVQLLTTLSRSGRLYEVDTRLRPSGRSGLLMTSLSAFEHYQRQEAWTWEHQSLLHARAVAGDRDVQSQFEQCRLAILTDAIDRERLRENVVHMRSRMRKELSRAGSGEFDMKQDPGGVVDIEFIAQYLVLRHAKEFPPLLTFPDTIRQLESLGSINLLPQAHVDQLVQAYRAYRRARHHRSLESKSDVLDQATWQPIRQVVQDIWAQVFDLPPSPI